MSLDAHDRYLRLLDQFGDATRWYQLGTDVPFAAVVAAVEEVDSADVLRRREALSGHLAAGDEAALISFGLAAVSAARKIEAAALVAAADTATEVMRTGIRSHRIGRIAAVILAAGQPAESGLAAERVLALHQDWLGRHRVRTGSYDLLLAAVADNTGVDRAVGLDRASRAEEQLAKGGYPGEWELARILAIEPASLPVERYLRLAAEMSGRRRKPAADRRPALGIACLADHLPEELPVLLQSRMRDLPWGKHRPDAKTVLTLAALLTLGASVPPEHRLRDAFHALALRELYRTALEQAPSG